MEKPSQPARANYATLFVGAVVVLSTLAVGSVLVIFTVRPDKDNATLIATIFGFLIPTITGFLAMAIQQVHSSVNGRLTEFLELTAKSSKAEGRLQEKTESKNKS